MSRSSAQPFVWVAVVAALVLGTAVGLQFLGGPPADVERPGEATVATVDAAAPAPRPPAAVRPLAAPVVDAGPVVDASSSAVAPTSRGLAIFRDQAIEDVQRLGDDAADMERLWKVGRFSGSGPEAAQALQALIDKYGDTHRATCARYLLQRHQLVHGEGALPQRRQAAAQALGELIERDPESRCDMGTRASQLARFVLATQVYRHSDFERSVDLLKELAGAEPDEVDNLGVSLALRARAILQEVEASGR